jgi:hypothetical protein
MRFCATRFRLALPLLLALAGCETSTSVPLQTAPRHARRHRRRHHHHRAPAPSAAATASANANANAAGEGELDAGRVAAVLRQNIARIRGCYQQALLSVPTLQTRVEVRFTIDLDGTAAISQIATTNPSTPPPLGRCFAGVIEALSFPRPTGGSVDFSFPFNFIPGGGRSESVRASAPATRQLFVQVGDPRDPSAGRDVTWSREHPADVARLRDAFESHRPQLAQCYEAALAPYVLYLRVDVSLRVDPSGAAELVAPPRYDFVPAGPRECLHAALSAAPLPVLPGAPASLRVPVTFYLDTPAMSFSPLPP